MGEQVTGQGDEACDGATERVDVERTRAAEVEGDATLISHHDWLYDGETGLPI